MMVLALTCVALAGAQSPRFDTDTTVAVPQGSRLRLQNQGGDVTIKTWDRSQIRIQAAHSSRSTVEVDVRGQVVVIEAKGRRGPSSVVDYQLTVPAWMALDIGGMYPRSRSTAPKPRSRSRRSMAIFPFEGGGNRHPDHGQRPNRCHRRPRASGAAPGFGGDHGSRSGRW